MAAVRLNCAPGWGSSRKHPTTKPRVESLSTECVLESGVERRPGPLVIRVVLEYEVDLAICRLRHYEQFQIVLQLGCGPIRRGIRSDVDQLAWLPAYEMFIVKIVKRVPSSSQFPEARVNYSMLHGASQHTCNHWYIRYMAT